MQMTDDEIRKERGRRALRATANRLRIANDKNPHINTLYGLRFEEMDDEDIRNAAYVLADLYVSHTPRIL